MVLNVDFEVGSTASLEKDGALMALLKTNAGKKSICLALSVCFLGLIMPADAKKLIYQLPVSDKMTDGDSPTSETEKKAVNVNLAPIGLGDEKPADGAGATADAASDGGDPLLKGNISEKGFAGKGMAGSGDKNTVADGKEKTVVGKSLGDKIGKEKKAPSVAPLAIQPSQEEIEQTGNTVMDAEKRQLSNLWECTIERNPDIQFVIQKLQPTTDANHAMAATMKFLSSTLFGAMNMAPMMMPGGLSGANPAAMMGMGSGASLIQGLFQDKAQKAAKKQAISQEQATILYKIVRETADKLVASYRDYKKESTAVLRATQDLAELQTIAAEGAAKDPGKALEMEYTLRKAKRDIDKELEEQRLFRQQLTDLAGGDAVVKLDKELEDERSAVANLTGTGADAPKNDGPFVNPLVQNAIPNGQQTANSKDQKTY